MELTLLKGVGIKTEETLNKMNIYSIKDLIEYFPSYYEFFDLGLKQGKCNVIATVLTVPKIAYFRKNMNSMNFKVLVEDKEIAVTIYNRNFLSSHLTMGKKIVIQGTYIRKITATNIFFKYEPIKPRYRVKDMPESTFRKYILEALKYSKSVETLSNYTIDKYRLLTRDELIRIVHTPTTKEEVKQIYRRTKYEEFLLYQLELKQLKKHNKHDGLVIPTNPKIKDFIEGIDFKLTADQVKTVKEVLRDLSSEDSMNRLVQGDVGSGKTIISVIALYNTYLAGYQAVFMAPTEILAEQHYNKIKNYLPDVNVILLTSSLKSKKILKSISTTNAIIIGTHAVFQDDVEYNKLGLIVTDEQHRFGVAQRKKLASKGFKPNVLSMSATPIPRTLAISLFGDIDVSTIKELPMGRKDIITNVIKFKELANVIGQLKDEFSKGRQAYIVAPMIAESDKVDAIDIDRTFDFFTSSLDVKVEKLHGKMKAKDKELVMRKFINNDTKLLISTTVIEVGVDVSNATIMIILNADRFGLSQLHQLRGRVGRGKHQSYCYLVSDTSNELTIERLNVLQKTNNGFEISEEDLRLRGPGDFLGSRQSGFPEFTYGDIFKDFKILDIARYDAEEIVYNIEDSRHIIYKEYLEKVLGGLYD